MRLGRVGTAGLGAAILWVLLGLRWFDVASEGRPRWLDALPPWALALPLLVLSVAWWSSHRKTLGEPNPPGARAGLLLVMAAAFFFRLPLATQASAGFVTADGALSGLMAVQIRDGRAHPVFVPSVPYSGSLKSHLTAPLSRVMDASRAFALVSVLFYVAFVAGVFRLAERTGPGGAFTAVAAGLYLAFAPPFVTRYSLSNDGNYVEVLALGTWALVLAARFVQEPSARGPLALVAGILLGLAFWCHILAVMHIATVVLVLVGFDLKRGWRSLPPFALGLILGYWPGLLWNAANGWESFLYLVPGTTPAAVEGGPGLVARFLDHWLVLAGYDSGYPAPVDLVMRSLAVVAGLALLAGAVHAARHSSVACRVLRVFTAVNVGVALLALPYIPGNPRYLLFLMAPLPVFLALLLGVGWRRGLLAGIVAFGALGSLAQAPGSVRADAQWRAFAHALEAEGVRHCYTDFFLATKLNFLTEERLVCSSKLGPTTTEYFAQYRRAVDEAPEAALIPVNVTASEKLERRLERLGVAYERRDLMKPVLLPRGRKVDPEELFPGRSFPTR